jgi:hypothetical protein
MQPYVKVDTKIIYFHSMNSIFPFLVSSDRTYSLTLARQNSSKWTIDSSDTPILTYTNGPSTVSISMICSAANQDLLEVSGEISLQHYAMRLYSHCACWNGCNQPKSTTFPATTTASSTCFLLKN